VNLPADKTRWPREWLELWSERAGIMEFQGNLTRLAAEMRAEQDIRKQAAVEGEKERQSA
jgi:hypothetical protein